MVGFGVVAQQTPRWLTTAPPSLLIVPPLKAVDWVICEIKVVVSPGTRANVVKLISDP
jgi:hypothetical protein